MNIKDIKNYSSGAAVENSLASIDKNLVRMGASDIMRSYNNAGELKGIKFVLPYKGERLVYQLPARVETIFDVMWSGIKRPKEDTRERIKLQAERTAWKIIADWVTIQASIVLLEQAEVTEVFLPYLFNGTSNKTFFQTLKEGNVDLKSLMP